jgi:capsular polysaccharide biosynthesis protein
VLIGRRPWNDAPLVERLGISANAVERIPQFEIDEYFEVPELVVSTHLQPHRRNARVDPAWLNDYVRRLTGDDIPVPTRKLYFARASDSGARGGCVNRDEFDCIADEFGFERIYPERYSIAEQIRMLTECAEMLGEQGSALNWAFVMQPGTRVTTLRNYPLSKGAVFETFHNTMLAAREVAYNDIAAFTVGNSAQYEIDPSIVREALRTLPD